MSEDLDLLLQQLADESRAVRTINLTRLSDLPRAEAAETYAQLARLNPRRRLELVSMMTEQAEANVHLNFLAVLRECLNDGEAPVRKVAVDGLWEDERTSLVGPLVRLLAEDPGPEVRAAAAVSLGRFVLRGVLGEISDAYAERVARALRGAWSRPGEVVEVRRRALEGLAYTDEDGVDELIEAAYYDENDQMRQSAIFAMGRTADRRWARLVMTELGSGDPGMRYEAASAAGELALTVAVKPLIRLLDDADSAVRETAASALGKIGGRDARHALEACLESSDRGLVEAATDALEELAFNSEALDTPLIDYNPRTGRAGLDDEDDEDSEDDEDDEDDDAWADDEFGADEEDEWAGDEFGEDGEMDWDGEDEDDADDFDDDLEEDRDWPRRR
jgi:HEAT repeat protein